MPARQHRLHGDAIAHVDPPARRSAVTDLGNGAQRFMAGNHRHWRAQHVLELLVIATADATRFELQNRRVVIYVRDVQLHRRQLAFGGLHHGERFCW